MTEPGAEASPGLQSPELGKWHRSWGLSQEEARSSPRSSGGEVWEMLGIDDEYLTVRVERPLLSVDSGALPAL